MTSSLPARPIVSQSVAGPSRFRCPTRDEREASTPSHRWSYFLGDGRLAAHARPHARRPPALRRRRCRCRRPAWYHQLTSSSSTRTSISPSQWTDSAGRAAISRCDWRTTTPRTLATNQKQARGRRRSPRRHSGPRANVRPRDDVLSRVFLVLQRPRDSVSSPNPLAHRRSQAGGPEEGRSPPKGEARSDDEQPYPKNARPRGTRPARRRTSRHHR